MGCHNCCIYVLSVTNGILQMEKEVNRKGASYIYRIRCFEKCAVVSDYSGEITFYSIPDWKVVRVLKVCQPDSWVWNFIFLSPVALMACVSSGTESGLVAVCEDFPKTEYKVHRILEESVGVTTLYQLKTQKNLHLVFGGGYTGKCWKLDWKKRKKIKECGTALGDVFDIKSILSLVGKEERVVVAGDSGVYIYTLGFKSVFKVSNSLLSSPGSLCCYSNRLLIVGGRRGTVGMLKSLDGETWIYQKIDSNIHNRASVNTIEMFSGCEDRDEECVAVSCGDDSRTVIFKFGDNINQYKDLEELDIDLKDRLEYLEEDEEYFDELRLTVRIGNTRLRNFHSLFA